MTDDPLLDRKLRQAQDLDEGDWMMRVVYPAGRTPQARLEMWVGQKRPDIDKLYAAAVEAARRT